MEDCLARYPEYAGELRPLLDTVTRVGWVITPAPTAAARAAGEQRMLAALARKRGRQTRSNPIVRFGERLLGPLALGGSEGLRPAWNLLAVGLAVLVLVFGGVAAVASADSLPGDLLYPVKLASQRVQLALAFEPTDRQLLEDQFSAQQRSDVHAVLKRGRQVTVEFEGRLDQMAGDLWMVGGLPVTIQDTTVIVGQMYPGAMVSVEGGLTGSGLLLATRVALESAPAPLATETPEPLATETPDPLPTETPGSTETLQPPPTLEPMGMMGVTESPEPTATPALTQTPIPTETPEPTGTAAATPKPPETRQPADTSPPDDSAEVPDAPESPEPAETADPDEPPESDETSAPTEVPEAGGTPEPEETLEPDRTAEPDDTAEPARTDEPDEAPDPTEAAGPDETPEHDQTPEPDDNPEPDPSPEPDDAPEPTGEPDD
jgi:hypothetical protein